MNSRETLVNFQEWGARVLQMTLQGIGDEEADRKPESGNSIRWLFGHILNARDDLISMLGGEKLFDGNELQFHRRGIKEQYSSEDLQPFDNLKRLNDESLARVASLLREMDEDRLSKVDDERSLADNIESFFGHELYHVGQIGLLRRWAGLPGAIP